MVYSKMLEMATKKIEELARHAVANDDWMLPNVESGDDLEDFDQFSMAHRGQWESTCHFQTLYGSKISEAIDELIDAGFGKGMSEPRIFLLEELQSAFWEQWEGSANLYKAWETATE